MERLTIEKIKSLKEAMRSNMNVYFYDDVMKVFDELLEKRNAEEQGLLLRLPCKVGDTVYTACSWGIESGVVGSIEIIGDMIFVNNPYRAMIGQAHNIFLTKEEAEYALARMEKGNG